MRNKRGVELISSPIIYIILGILLLGVLLLIFSSEARRIFLDFTIKIKNILGLWNSSQISP